MSSKYKNKPQVYNGLKFGSIAELKHYQWLKVCESDGLITDLKTQVKFELIPKNGKERACFYIADFVYFACLLNKQIVEDVKGGSSTREFIIKRKLMLHVHGIEVIEIRK